MKFYVLETPRADSIEDRLGRTDAIEEEDFKTGDAIHCSRCNRPLTSLRWLPPYRVELETWGRDYADLVRKANDVMVSERLMEFFRRGSLQGLKDFAPVEVFRVRFRRGKIKEQCPNYFTTMVPLGPAAVDQKASGYVWGDESSVCPVCLWDDLKRFYRIVINLNTWNGDDIFFPIGGTELMVSERFKILWEEKSFQGITLSPAATYGQEYCPNEKEDWALRHFDETLAILESRNLEGQCDDLVQAMRDTRGSLAKNPQFQWIENFRRFGNRLNDVADASSEATYKLLRNPW
jgi:hypothetical protein